MGKFIDLTGLTFGRWTVLGRGSQKSNHVHWVCKCSCIKNTVREVSGSSLSSGASISCGCYKDEQTSTRHGRHFQSGTRLYNIWKGLSKRCFNKNNIGYALYGGRGISVCDQWRGNFENFRAWSVANGYRPNLSIDRIDSNGDYTPDNCRWATSKTQANNTRRNHFITLKGKTKLLHEWSEHIGITSSNVLSRIGRGLSEEEILKPRYFKRAGF